MSTWAILLCAGSGTRMGGSINKTFLPLGGVPAFIRCGRILRDHCDGIVVVCRKDEIEKAKALCNAQGFCPDTIVPGGSDRQTSVDCGLGALPKECDTVLIHDGARALLSDDIVERVISSTERFGNGVAAIPVKDTIKETDENGIVSSTPDRSRLWQTQTPQGFNRKLLEDARKRCAGSYTDDAALIEKTGGQVFLVMGSTYNFKLTTQEDYKLAQGCFSACPRIGHGYDAHRLTEGRKLILCGVDIPFSKGLLGHSDADVATHALMDALLGASALGDIGKLFPDSEKEYEGISSMVLLKRVHDLIASHHFLIGNCDITLIAQQPKLAPYISQMRENVASSLRLSTDCVSVKATTTEGMGYEGRGEGISALASVILYQREDAQFNR